MTTTYNPTEVDRLIAEAREVVDLIARPLTDKRSATYAAERLGPVNKAIDRYAAMADQLEAAKAEIERLRTKLREVTRGYDCGSWMIIGEAIDGEDRRAP